MRGLTVQRSVLAAVVLGTLVLPQIAAAASIGFDLRVTRQPVTIRNGDARPAHELIAAMARPGVGLTQSSLQLTAVTYSYQLAAEADDRVRLEAGSLKLARDGALRVRIAIKYPKLSDAQYRALRDSPEYPKVYGLIRGIVEHEQEHATVYADFARAVRKIYALPPVGESPVVTPREEEGGRAAFRRFLNDRVTEAYEKAKKAQDARQKQIDATGKVTRVDFHYTEPVQGTVPPPFFFQTKGKIRVKFEVPKGNPRPPEPKTKY